MKPDINLLKDGSNNQKTGGFPGGTPLRVLLYSHDSWGLGHLRRSLAIAGALTAHDALCNVLVVTGSPCATQFNIPERCDILKLPTVSKDEQGQYIPRSFSSGISETVDLRRRLILESYRSFDPHLVVVDHQLIGMSGEILDTLREARQQGKKLVYGMRDVLDEPSVVHSAWDSSDHRWALTQAYDRIFIYGTPDIYDSRIHYPVLEPVRNKIEFTGYIAAPLRKTTRNAIPPFRKKVLVTMGGGEDGGDRIESYLEALMIRPVAWDSHIVTGPLMDQGQARHFKRVVHRNGLADRVRVSRFYPDLPNLLHESDAVVSMAGYNSCAEIMQSGVPAVLMPRCHPRKEQLIRATRFEELGLAHCVVGNNPEVIRQAVETALEGRQSPQQVPRLDGLDEFCRIVEELLGSDPSGNQRFHDHSLKIAAE